MKQNPPTPAATTTTAPICGTDTPPVAKPVDVSGFSGLFKARQWSVGVQGRGDMKGS